MPEPLEEQYFSWLYQKVASLRSKNPARTYWSLLRQLHATEFVWFVPNDDNRVEDGRDLRIDFLDDVADREDASVEWMSRNCSMLEMLIALAQRLVYEADGTDGTDDWFWHLMSNLELSDYTDRYFNNRFTTDLVDEITSRVIQRTYGETGHGGLFPLNDPRWDQRKVELWSQMSSYLLERD